MIDLSVVVSNEEVKIVGLENDLDLMIPAFCNVFEVTSVSQRYPCDDNPLRSTVYLAIRGLRIKERGKK